MNKHTLKCRDKIAALLHKIGLNIKDFRVDGDVYNGLFSPTVTYLGMKVEAIHSIVHKSLSTESGIQAIDEAVDHMLGHELRRQIENDEVAVSEAHIVLIKFFDSALGKRVA